MERFTSVTFNNFKAFKQFSIALTSFNVLVGPNNSGKSTVIAAFRILAEAMRKARARYPQLVQGPGGETYGYRVDVADLPVAAENIFSDYDDTKPATIRFRISNGNHLLLFFPERERCHMIAETTGRPVRTTSAFRSEFNCEVAFVPVLGPLEHNELLYLKEAARQALITHRASRNFRNIWHHRPEQFSRFRDLLRSSWPGMDIELPTVDRTADKPRLHMFCVENRIPRELFWAGFGFQVWCQMLTYIVEGQDASLLAIDEPDIYLHSDLQRQLLSLLKEVGPDILIATHSPELVSEADPNDILVVTKAARSAKRLSDPTQLQMVFRALGSNLNPTLTQLAKSRRALFVEGKDFQIVSRFANKLKKMSVANRAQFAVIPAEGFNPQRIMAVSAGIETTLGMKVLTSVLFDRDYRSKGEIKAIEEHLCRQCNFVRIHRKKEIENFLLVPAPLHRAVQAAMKERQKRTGEPPQAPPDTFALLEEIVGGLRLDTQSRYVAAYVQHERTVRRSVSETTLTTEALTHFEDLWSEPVSRLASVPGKEVLARLNTSLLRVCKVSLSAGSIIRAFNEEEIDLEMVELIAEIDEFSATAVPDS
jgi:energy-coupling factor transporter ATP-binding protein EcfA2